MAAPNHVLVIVRRISRKGGRENAKEGRMC